MPRTAVASDLLAIRELFRDTITNVNIKDYSEEQIAAWSSGWEDEQRWYDKFSTQHFVVEENNGALTGFSSVDGRGHLDYMYVHKDHQRQGIATALLYAIEHHSMKNGIMRLTSDVSITARPFFEHHGFHIVEKQQVQYKGMIFVNFKMQKNLRIGSGGLH